MTAYLVRMKDGSINLELCEKSKFPENEIITRITKIDAICIIDVLQFYLKEADK